MGMSGHICCLKKVIVLHVCSHHACISYSPERLMSLSTALHGVLNSATYLRTWVSGSIFISLSTQLQFGQGHSQIISLEKWWLQQDASNLPREIANDIFSKTRDATLLEDWERDISNRNAVYPFFTQFQIGFGCFYLPRSGKVMQKCRSKKSNLWIFSHWNLCF